jgi:hypothetical protein
MNPSSRIELNNGKYIDDQMGNGIPDGGTTGQVLSKASNDDYDVEWVTGGGGSTPDLQQVTDVGAITTNTITVGSLSGYFSQILNSAIGTENATTGTYIYLDSAGFLGLYNSVAESYLKNTNVTNNNVVLEFPNKPTGSYTIATTSDISGADNISPLLLMGA